MRELNRRQFAQSSVGLAAGGWGAAVIATGSCKPKQEIQPQARRRRIIYNDDGDTRNLLGKPSNVADFLSRRFDWTKNTQVDSYFWCIGNGDDPPYGVPTIPEIGDGAKITLAAVRQAGQEAVISVRMNDTHDSYTRDLKYPFKQGRSDLLIDPTGAVGKYKQDDMRYWVWSALDYAQPAVREHMLSYIKRVVSEHAPDALEMDFTRQPFGFKFGEEEKGTPLMTQFVTEVRQQLEAISKQAGKKTLLVAHLPDTPDKSLRRGLDGPTWLRRKLLDVLITGSGYAPFNECWKEHRDLAAKAGIPCYPAINCSSLAEIKRIEALRGAATNWWYGGAPGLYLFNPFVPVDMNMIPAETMYGEFKHIGDPATLVGLDKVFCADYIHDNHLLGNSQTVDAPLPAAVSTRARAIPLTVGEDLGSIPAGKQRQMTLRLQTAPAEGGKRLQLELNGRKLALGSPDRDGWIENAVDAPPLIQGNNYVRMSVPAGEVTLRRLQLWVKYV